MFLPIVLDKINNDEKSFDIYSRLLEDRIIFLNGEINTEVASAVIAQLLFLESKDKEKDISLYINSPGGSVDAGLAIYDTMNLVKNKVRTICIGLCASMAGVLLSAGEKGERYSLKNSRIMLHQPLGGVEGKASDIKIAAEQILLIREKLNAIMAKNTSQPKNKVQRDTAKDFYMSADEGKAYGVIDHILGEE